MIACLICRSLLKLHPPIKLKQFSLIFFLNHINNSFDHAKMYMTSLVHKHLEELFQLLTTPAGFLFLDCTVRFHLIVKQ